MTLILIFKSKSQNAVFKKMKLRTEHYPVYESNTYLYAEKIKKAQNSSLGLCTRLPNEIKKSFAKLKA